MRSGPKPRPGWSSLKKLSQTAPVTGIRKTVTSSAKKGAIRTPAAPSSRRRAVLRVPARTPPARGASFAARPEAEVGPE
ncbi:hypothetical protein KDA82_32775, partial [Streptomyces daliensis]|nr:hypothetical protein [Streptomyces daliensis]